MFGKLTLIGRLKECCDITTYGIHERPRGTFKRCKGNLVQRKLLYLFSRCDGFLVCITDIVKTKYMFRTKWWNMLCRK